MGSDCRLRPQLARTRVTTTCQRRSGRPPNPARPRGRWSGAHGWPPIERADREVRARGRRPVGWGGRPAVRSPRNRGRLSESCPGPGRWRGAGGAAGSCRRPTARSPAESPTGSRRAVSAGPPAALGSTAAEMLPSATGSAWKAWARSCCLAATAAAKALRLVTLLPRADELVCGELGQSEEGALEIGQRRADLAVVGGEVGAHHGQIVGERLVRGRVLRGHLAEVAQVVEEGRQLRALGRERIESRAQRGEGRVQRGAVAAEGVGRFGHECGQGALGVGSVRAERPGQPVEVVDDPVHRDRHRRAGQGDDGVVTHLGPAAVGRG